MSETLTESQIEKLAQSVSYHSAGETYGTGHLRDFGADTTRTDIIDNIKQMLNDPNTRFFQNTNDDPKAGGTVFFFNQDSKSILIFNPNQLNDPKFDQAGKVLNDADNFAGTFLKSFATNEDGMPISRNTGRLLSEGQANRAFKGDVNNFLKQTAGIEGVPKDQIPVKTIGESDDWAKQISQYDDAISEGLEKGVARIEAGDFKNAAPDLKKGGAALDLADGAKEISDLAKAGRLGVNITGAGFVIGAASLLLMEKAHAGQRDLADDLKDAGIIDEEAHQAYLELNKDTENMLYGDLALSTADPTGASIVITAAVEKEAHDNFKDWADEHAPALSQEHFEALSMSIFSGKSARADMLWEAKDHLPSTTEGQPEFLHRSIELTNLHNEVRGIGYSHAAGTIYNAANPIVGSFVGNMTRSDLSEAVNAAKDLGIDIEVSRVSPALTIYNLNKAVSEELAGELDTQFGNPEQTAQLLGLVPIDDRMEYVRRLAASENDPAQMAQDHPEIAAYVQAYDESWTGWDWTMSEDNPLKENPDLLNNYIIERTAGSDSLHTHLDHSPEDFSFSPTEIINTLGINGPDADLDITPEDLKLEATEPYMRAAIPLENMRFGIENDAVEMRDMWNSFGDPQIGQSIIGLADKRFPEEMGELRIEAAERVRQQEFLKQYEREQSMRPNAGMPIEMDPTQRMMNGPSMGGMSGMA